MTLINMTDIHRWTRTKPSVLLRPLKRSLFLAHPNPNQNLPISSYPIRMIDTHQSLGLCPHSIYSLLPKTQYNKKFHTVQYVSFSPIKLQQSIVGCLPRVRQLEHKSGPKCAYKLPKDIIHGMRPNIINS